MAEFPDDDLPPTGWDGLPDRARGALESAWDSGVPGMASAVHARWWQLETWLRSLAYVELRAAYGAGWLDIIGKNTVNRAETEMKFSHMTSTDANLVLSHLDVSALFEMIKKDWHLFERALIDQEIWEGRVRELKQVRHRIAHCRRPHRDDLLRIEQMLRDLERGAFRAIASFNTPRDPDRSLDDPVVEYWYRGKHPEARLIEHADQRYDITFRLAYTRRPWAEPLRDGQKITGTPGYLWHATFYMRDRGVIPGQLWQDSYLDMTGARDHLVYLCIDGPSVVDFSFPAVDSPEAIANDIGSCLNAVLYTSRVLRSEAASAARRQKDIDPRVQVDTAWTIVDETTVPVSIFSAS